MFVVVGVFVGFNCCLFLGGPFAVRYKLLRTWLWLPLVGWRWLAAYTVSFIVPYHPVVLRIGCRPNIPICYVYTFPFLSLSESGPALAVVDGFVVRVGANVSL